MQQQGIIGDSAPTELPQTVVDPEALEIEKRAAQFTTSDNYKELKEHFERRIEYYQAYLPDGTGKKPDIKNWEVATAIIAEFQMILDLYEKAKEAVDGRKGK